MGMHDSCHPYHCNHGISWDFTIWEKEVSLQENRSVFEFVPWLFGIVLQGGYLYGAWPRTVLILIEFKYIVPEFDNLSCSVPVGFSRKDSNFLRSFPYGITPSTQCYLFPILICFFHVETHKASTSIWGGSQVLLHRPWHEQVHSARSSCTAPERVRKRSELG